MIKIKQNGVRAVIYPQTGTVMLCDALTFSLLDVLTPPFSDEFPMGLRYSFAKYDSADLKRAYETVKEIYRAAEETPVPLTVRTASIVSADKLPDRITFENLIRDCPETFVCTIIAKNTADADAVTAFCAMVQKDYPMVAMELRCSGDYPYAKLPVRRVYLECGDSKNISSLLPLPDHVILSCVCSKDMQSEADRLYRLGYKKFSLLPSEDYDKEMFAADMEKLTREWIRIERNTQDAAFLPFTFTAVQPGLWMDDKTLPTDTLPGYFYNAGLLSHLTPVTEDSEVLAKCVECAIVLQAQRKQ